MKLIKGTIICLLFGTQEMIRRINLKINKWIKSYRHFQKVRTNKEKLNTLINTLYNRGEVVKCQTFQHDFGNVTRTMIVIEYKSKAGWTIFYNQDYDICEVVPIPAGQ